MVLEDSYFKIYSASAGSGKTYALTGAYLKLLLSSGSPLKGKPKLILGTKCPSTTSTCIQSTADSLSICMVSANLLKSQASIDGANKKCDFDCTLI